MPPTRAPAWLVSRECLDATGQLDERYFPNAEETSRPRRGDQNLTVRYVPAALAVYSGGEPSNAPGPGYVCFSAQDWWYHNRAHSDTQLLRGVSASRKTLLVNSIGLRMPAPGRSSQVAGRILRKPRSVARFIRQPLPNFYVMSPLPLPFYSSPLLRRVNAVLVRTQVRIVCALLRIDRPVIIVTLPTAWDVVRPMRRHSLIYNRSDLHSAFPEAHRPTIEALEAQLLEHADRVVYASRALLAAEHAKTGDRAYFLDRGVDVDHFVRQALPADLQAIPSPRIGFFGGLDDRAVDFDLLERIAVEVPHASLVLIGNATHPMERFDKYPNVHWLGFRPYESIPAYGSGFHVAIMPWQNNPWIHYANPIKLKEYLALGLPVVSTPFAELTHYTDRVRATRTHAEFIAAIHESLQTGRLLSPAATRASVLPITWQSQTAKLITLAEPHPLVERDGTQHR
jgi:glycosyltransferase involved in cell wall biosynthesis